MPEWMCAECKWRKQYMLAKAHLKQHGAYNKWIVNIRNRLFQLLPEEKKAVASSATVDGSLETFMYARKTMGFGK